MAAESVESASVFELPLPAVGGAIPRGSDEPFRRPVSTDGGGLSRSCLFMLFIRSRTELFREAELDAERSGEAEGFATVDGFSAVAADNDEDGGSVELDPEPPTLVISPDLRSTPTIDHGRGLGKGLGFAVIERLLGEESEVGEAGSSFD